MELDAPMPIKDFPLLWKVYDHIQAHPEEWRQSYWMTQDPAVSCGTSFCFAGHAVHMTVPTYKAHWDDSGQAYLVEFDGQVRQVSEVAQKALGLSGFEADGLFDACNTIEEIRSYIARWEAEDNSKF